MKRVIITGATGAIGSALIRELISNDIEVLVICRNNSCRNDRIPTHPLVHKLFCDLRDLDQLENAAGNTYDVFYHFAWRGTIGPERNDMYLQNENVKNSLDAVRLARRFGCHTFIGAGSQAEYGRVEGLLGADTPTHPETGYGIAKLCSGQMTRELAHSLGMKHIWTRILSVYGPYDGERTMVMTVINNLCHHIVPKCTKGEQEWDYLYSKDAAKAFRMLGESGMDGKTYVLGSGSIQPLAKYIKAICSAAAPDIEADFGAIPYTPKQVMYLGANISELQKDTGFTPEYSFEEGIRETVRWYKENY